MVKAAEVAKAEALVEANPEPASPTPFADRTGIAPWALDLLMAALLSIGANGLAATLVAFGASPAANDELAKLKATFSGPVADPAANAKTVAETIAGTISGKRPDPTPPTPPKGRKKRKPLPENETATIYAFPAKHPVIAALENVGGSVASNHALAELMGVTDGEASKRWQEVRHLLTVRRVGKETRISLLKTAATG